MIDDYLRAVAAPFAQRRRSAPPRSAAAEFRRYARDAELLTPARGGDTIAAHGSEGGVDTRLRVLREIHDLRKQHFSRRFDQAASWFKKTTFVLPADRGLVEEPACDLLDAARLNRAPLAKRNERHNEVRWAMRDFEGANIGSVPGVIEGVAPKQLLDLSTARLREIRAKMKPVPEFAKPSGNFVGTLGSVESLDAREHDAAIGVSKEGHIVAKYPSEESYRRHGEAARALVQLVTLNERMRCRPAPRAQS